MNKKRYSIDDLGKFDGSNMTIKVNGKQIYPQKRYAIVRVDNTCPSGHDGCKVNLVCVQDRNNIKKKCCENCLYGDTKEQLIRKVAQVFFKRKLKSYKKLFDIVPNKADAKQVYKRCLDVAKEIVEFLGVE